ncbi:glycosyltransferase family 2 protein [Cyclobacterium salsum]|uniref:glycosyltransferase family 2 protein n=1 Tax=Cyclobacterium salsum TaxID=2666329 RepID=UPI0013920E9E|nr:glycosyltransferase family 2 protein [Cyclobacterium salsum]
MDSSLAIIILNWNGWDFTCACLKSLERSGFSAEAIIVVDNGSDDGSDRKIKKQFPRVQLILHPVNAGFTGGNNLGIKAALDQGYAYIMLLNNDTEVGADFWKPLLEEMQGHPETAAVQPLIYFLHPKSKIWNAGGKYQSWLGMAQTIHHPYSNDPYPTDWITGCAILVRASVLEKIGLLDEHYFAYFEDVDWSLRMRKEGYTLKVVPKSIIFHEAGAASKSKQEGEEGFLNPKVHFLNVRNQLFQLRKYSRVPGNWLAWPFHFLKFGFYLVYFTLKGRKSKRKAVIEGIIAGFKTPIVKGK